jgi:hypothetical protein
MAYAVRQMDEYRRAVDHVTPVVGNITVACDSAADVYHAALVALGKPAFDVHDVKGLRAIFDAVTKGRRAFAGTVAMDEKQRDDLIERFPAAARLLK